LRSATDIFFYGFVIAELNMPDPVSIGALAASALALAGEESLKTVVGAAVKESYQALKNKVAKWSATDVTALEKTPGSQARRAVVAELIDGQSNDDKAAVCTLAKQLIAALQGSGLGLDIGQLAALQVQLGDITVTEGTGVRIGRATVQETFNTGKITVGRTSGKS
jgi:hypothetical protein